jgi:hypothetical protein
MATIKELEAKIEEMTVLLGTVTNERDTAVKAADDMRSTADKLRPFVLPFTEGKAPNQRTRALVVVLGKPANIPAGYARLPKEAGDGMYLSAMLYSEAEGSKRIAADLPDAVSDEAYEEMVRAEMERRIAERLAERKARRTT